MATYGYARVSTAMQADHGDSLETQQRRIQGYAQQEGLELTHMFVERGVSGGRPFQDRPEGGALLDRLAPGDLVVSPKLDRCFRSAGNALEVLELLRRRDVGLVLLDLGGNVSRGGVAGLVFTIMAAIAAFERDRIAERIAEVKVEEKRQGKYRGGKSPFGFRLTADKRLEAVAEEQAAIDTMRRLRAAGKSLRAIQRAIEVEHGFHLSHMAVGRVVADVAEEASS